MNDEIHHTGWNACSSCFGDPSKKRNLLILPGLVSTRMYAVDVDSNPKAPKIFKVELHCVGPNVSLSNSNFISVTKTDDFNLFDCLQTVEPTEVFDKTALAYPHTVHCIPGGKIMISCMGDPEGNAKGMYCRGPSYVSSIRIGLLNTWRYCIW